MPARTDGFGPYRYRLLYVLVLLPIVWLSYLNRFFQLDDALIYFRYVRNLFEGSGLVYNKGVYFNGLTAPLFTYVLIAASYVTENIHIAAIVVSAVFMIAGVSLFTVVFAAYTSRYTAVYSGMLMACSLYFYCTYGMETTLYIFMIGACLYFFETKKNFELGISCALLLLTRPEGVFLILAMIIQHVRERRPFPGARHSVIPAVILLGNCMFNKVYYGAFFPSSSLAKVYQGMSGMWGRWPTAFLHWDHHYGWFFDSNGLLMSGVTTLAVCGVLSLGLTRLNIVSMCFLSFCTAFYVLFNIPYYHWYYAPYYAFGYFYAGVGVFQIFRKINHFSRKPVRVFCNVFFSALLVCSLYAALSHAATECSAHGPSKKYRDIGIWFRNNTPPNSKIGALEIGTIGWYSGREIVDMCGLVSPENAKLLGEKDFSTWLTLYSPDYILVHNHAHSLEKVAGDRAVAGEYKVHPDFEYSGYVLYVKK
jgi:arabinofuranosyltransferase